MVTPVTKFLSWLTGTATSFSPLTQPANPPSETIHTLFSVGCKKEQATSLKVIRAWRGEDKFKRGRLVLQRPTKHITSFADVFYVKYEDDVGEVACDYAITAEEIYQCILDTHIEAVWD